MTCASLALADAGVEMYDLVIGCSLVSLFLVNTEPSMLFSDLVIIHSNAKISKINDLPKLCVLTLQNSRVNN